MARTRYATSGGDVAVGIDGTTGVLSLPLASANPAPFTVHDSFTGGSQVTDLSLDAAGSSPTSTVPAPTVSAPQSVFYGPDGYTASLYLQDAAGRRWRVDPDSAGGATIDESGLAHLADAETITGAWDFIVAPGVPDDAFPTSKIDGLDEALATGSVSTAAMTTALTNDGHGLQAQFLAAAGATDSETRDLFASILGLLRSPTVGKVVYNRDFTAATAATVTRPNGTDTTLTVVRWRATDGTTTVPTAYINGNDEIRVVRQA